ncbi:MAG: energy transducer TonB [Mucilaginibacter sp.]|nr:energy transducer TonB [Mucilaginibacter sp.]
MNKLVLICLFCFGVTVSKAEKIDTVGGKIKSNAFDKKVFSWVEHQPHFPDGVNALKRFLAANLVYPESAKIKGIKGTVVVNFIVERDGSLSDIKIGKGLSRELDAEAIRVVRSSPKWIAGMQNGNLARVAYSWLINFPPEPPAVPKIQLFFISR